MTFKPITLFFAIAITTFWTFSKAIAQTDTIVAPQKEGAINDSLNKKEDSKLQTGWYYISDTPTVYKRQLDKTNEFYFINPEPIVTARNFKKVEIPVPRESPDYYPALLMELDSNGTKALYAATKKSVGKKLAFIVFNRLMETLPIRYQRASNYISFYRAGYGEAEIHLIKMAIEYSK